MKETRFIDQNKEKWLESENLLKSRQKDPEKLTNLFTQVIDDLSYSRTHYPNRSVRVYLNKLGRDFFSIIYSNRKERKSRFKLFWTDELPQIVYNSRKELLISFVIFLVAMAIGVFSAINDPSFTSSILGDTYVQMTKENIEKGDPMAVYKKANELEMFLSITINNLQVAFRTYVFGVFMSVGTVVILLYNGIMVGCFQYFFVERDLLDESALTIWLHGTLEISSIILAGGAGLILGSGLIFPGTYSRIQAFQISAVRSFKLMLGLAPIFIMAALIESYLTRYTETPDILRLALILLSAGFIIWYFIIYPHLKAKEGFSQPLEETRLSPTSTEKIEYDKIKNNGEVIKDTFMFYNRYAGKILGWSAVVAFFGAGVELALEDERSKILITEFIFILFDNVFYAFKTPTAEYLILNTIAASLIIYRINVLIMRDSGKHEKINAVKFVQTNLIPVVIFGTIFWLEGFGVLILVFIFAILMIATTALHAEGNILLGAASTWKYSISNFLRILGLQLILLLLALSFLIVLSAPLLYFNLQVLKWNFTEEDTWAATMMAFIETFVKLFGFNLILAMITTAAGISYFALHEIMHAEGLKNSITQIAAKYERKR